MVITIRSLQALISIVEAFDGLRQVREPGYDLMTPQLEVIILPHFSHFTIASRRFSFAMTVP